MRSTTTQQTCAVCMKNYSAPFWLSKIKKTCSKKCGYALVSNKSRTRRTKQCSTCSVTFISKPSTKGRFCSTQCYWNSKTRRTQYRCVDCKEQVSPVKSVSRCLECLGKHRTGINHWNWRIDRTSLRTNDKKHLDAKYLLWAKAVKNRDGWKCQSSNSTCSGRLEAHHIFRWADYRDLRYELNNGITLCHAHHPRRRAEEKRLVPVFQELVTASSATL